MNRTQKKKLNDAIGKARKASNFEQESEEVEYGEDYINIVCVSKRIRSEEDAIKAFKIDTEKWEVEKITIKTSEGYRKDRRVQWHVLDGKVISGDVDDSGKLLIAPMFHVQVKFKRRTREIKARYVIQGWIKDAKKYSPKYPKIKYGKIASGMTYEIAMPDIHIGRQTWKEESGDEYNIELARWAVHSTLDELLNFVHNFQLRRIILPIGNDFYNVDNQFNTTSHGTPQQEETRWSKTFREGQKLATQMIEKCSEVAPVDVLIVAGNHDEERTFYLGELLAIQFDRNQNVTVEHTAMKRKYYHFGRNLIGFTHGYHEKIAKLPSIMPIEVPELWAKSDHREWHLGDKHHKVDFHHTAEDVDGVTIRLLRSLSGRGAWEFDKGFVGTPRGSEGFLWDNDHGVIAQYVSLLKERK